MNPATVDPAAMMLFQQLMASVMTSPYAGISGPGPAPDPIFDPTGYAAHSERLRKYKRSQAESIARSNLSYTPFEMTQEMALSPIIAKLPSVNLFSLTPRQATFLDTQKVLWLSYKTRRFRSIELPKFDDDIAGRKEAMIAFGDSLMVAMFGHDWNETSGFKYNGKMTPSRIYDDHVSYPGGYQYAPPAMGDLCDHHASMLDATSKPPLAARPAGKTSHDSGKGKQETDRSEGRKNAEDGKAATPSLQGDGKRSSETWEANEFMRVWRLQEFFTDKLERDMESGHACENEQNKVAGRNGHFVDMEAFLSPFHVDEGHCECADCSGLGDAYEAGNPYDFGDPWGDDYPPMDLDDPYGLDGGYDMDYLYDPDDVPYGFGDNMYGIDDGFYFDNDEGYPPYGGGFYDDYEEYMDIMTDLKPKKLMSSLGRRSGGGFLFKGDDHHGHGGPGKGNGKGNSKGVGTSSGGKQGKKKSKKSIKKKSKGKAANQAGNAVKQEEQGGTAQDGKGKGKAKESKLFSSFGSSVVPEDKALGTTPSKPSVPPQRSFGHVTPLGASKVAPMSPSTIASVGLNLAKPAAAVAGGFRFSVPNTVTVPAPKALQQNTRLASESNTKPAKTNFGLHKKANAASGGKSAGASGSTGEEVKLTFEIPGPSGFVVQAVGAKTAPTSSHAGITSQASVAAKPAAAQSSPNKTAQTRKRKKVTRGDSNDMTQSASSGSAQPVKKKIPVATAAAAVGSSSPATKVVPAPLASGNQPRTKAATATTNTAKSVPVLGFPRQQQPQSTVKPKPVKYEVVVYRKPFAPSKRPGRDNWHGRVGL
ncbi:glycosyltransferase [Pseudozyma hubeiensis SY62]|uniref:Glycosyltransferase n=1 Tax=Pseudozyma hubeiensis (strain SY62) TaxID=1305764 RepID=R9PBK2_PSEHS|nr:glycosyltransferase [Pseudozyma hubeiensis SY62]GAC98724.1 glycosyltransferase [Pseudozyma hubeiensis SY62]